MPINFNTWNHTNQSTGNDNNFSAYRALTGLKSVFIILHNSDAAWYKQANSFFHPIVSSQNDAYGIADEHQFQVQIGSKLIPEYPINSLAESLSQLCKTVGQDHPFNMSGRWYRITIYYWS